MSDTPRTDAAYFKPHATMYDLAGEMKLIERELNAANERIKRLESWIESLEVLEQHSGILPEREWFGSEIGYLRKGEAVYKGEAKP